MWTHKYIYRNEYKRLRHTIVYQLAMSDIRITGRVKWFNKKSGFGFLTVCGESEHKDKDIFAHYSSISGEDSQYKYLVQGEYVEFDLVSTEGEKHEFQAANVGGVLGGPTMCKTHSENPRPPQRSEGEGGAGGDRRPPRNNRRHQDSYDSQDAPEGGKADRARVSKRY